MRERSSVFTVLPCPRSRVGSLLLWKIQPWKIFFAPLLIHSIVFYNCPIPVIFQSGNTMTKGRVAVSSVPKPGTRISLYCFEKFTIAPSKYLFLFLWNGVHILRAIISLYENSDIMQDSQLRRNVTSAFNKKKTRQKKKNFANPCLH